MAARRKKRIKNDKTFDLDNLSWIVRELIRGNFPEANVIMMNLAAGR